MLISFCCNLTCKYKIVHMCLKKHPADLPSSIPEAMKRFFFHKEKGPMLFTMTITFLIGHRVHLDAPFTHRDLAAIMTSIFIGWIQEYLIHHYLLHSTWKWVGQEQHQQHHDHPYLQICIDPPQLILLGLLAANLIFRLTLSPPMAQSATIGYALAGLWYEWMHYVHVVHIKVKPKSKIMKRLRNNHIRHHLIDDGCWFGFSHDLLDMLVGTWRGVPVRTKTGNA